MSDQSTNPEVEWRDVSTYPGYQASADGDIRTLWLPGKSLGRGPDAKPLGRAPPTMGIEWVTPRQHVNDCGYKKTYVVTVESGKPVAKLVSVHKMVCLAFHGIPAAGMIAAHFPNRDKTDNRSCNLMWATNQENCEHKKLQGTSQHGERNAAALLTETEVLCIRRLHKEGMTPTDISRRFGMADTTIFNIVRRRTWKHI